MPVLLPLAIVVGVILLAALGPAVAPFPDALVGRPLLPPSGAHPLGTNAIGQDLFAQLIAGARASVLAGALGSAVSTVIAIVIGLAASAGRRADVLVRAAADLFLALPLLPLVMLVVALAGPSITTIAVTLGLVSWPAFARVIRAQTISELGRGHVLAARAIGCSRLGIAWRHLLPAIAPFALAKAVLTVQYVVLAEASLGFLGLGDPAVTSWGGAVSRALAYPLLFASGAWIWWLAPPALAIAAFVASLALVGTVLDRRPDRPVPASASGGAR